MPDDNEKYILTTTHLKNGFCCVCCGAAAAHTTKTFVFEIASR
jgi:hypothetical protein